MTPLDYADYEKWNTNDVLKVTAFFTERIEEFFESLVAMADIGLKSWELI